MVVVHSNENCTLNKQIGMAHGIKDEKPVAGPDIGKITIHVNGPEAKVPGIVSKKMDAPLADRVASSNGASSGVLTDHESCLAELARPRDKGLAPSLQELEKIYKEKQQQRLAERKRNEKRMYNAIHHPDTKKTVEPRGLTVPREFNLSCPNTPSRSRCTTPARTPSGSRCTTPLRSRSNTPARSVCMSSDGSSCGTPFRGCGRVSSNKALTVAHEPHLRTSYRPRSVSRQRNSEDDVPIWQDDLRGQREARASSRANSRRVSESPARSVRSNRSGWSRGMMTPLSRRSRDESCDSISSDMALSMPGSVRSRMERSCDSRASQRSRASHRSSCSRSSTRGLSTEEIEEIRIAAKRHQVKELMKLNRTRGRQAILCPQSTCTRRSISLTVPREFALSCPGTPSRSCMSDAGSDCEEGQWSRSLRSVPSQAWEPQLTVPKAPALRTEHRSRSTSRQRSGSSTPSKQSMSRHRLPREQVAIERHLQRAVAGQVFEDVSSTQTAKPAWDDSMKRETADEAPKAPKAPAARPTTPSEGHKSDSAGAKQCEEDLESWVRAAETHEERAKRAREVAEKKHKERAEKAAHLKCFTGPKSQASNRGRSGRSQGQAVSVHERLYQEKDERRRRKEEASLQKIDREEAEIRASAQRALGSSRSPGRTASPGRVASPARAASPAQGPSPLKLSPEPERCD